MVCLQTHLNPHSKTPDITRAKRAAFARPPINCLLDTVPIRESLGARINDRRPKAG